MNIKSAIKTFRLRTLPLSLSGVILGILTAVSDGNFYPGISILIVFTALSLQILANVSNELGDTLKGTDKADRLGPKYAVQKGDLTVDDLKQLIEVFVGLSCCFGGAAVWCAYQADWGALLSPSFYIMLALGVLSIIGAMGYTLGRKPYGYYALGDAGVFIFFGLLSVMGSYFLLTKELFWSLLLAASGCGLLSVAVLNINNMRDIDSDKRTRLTIPMVIGLKNAKIYHTTLIATSQVLFLLFVLNRSTAWTSYIFLIFIPFWVWHVKEVWKREGKNLDPMLPPLSLGALAQATILGAFI